MTFSHNDFVLGTVLMFAASGIGRYLLSRSSSKQALKTEEDATTSNPATEVVRSDGKAITKPPVHKQYAELLAVNFHFTRQCNYSCGFCFHTAKTSHVEPLDRLYLILKSLRDHGCKKINFAGGEPFLYPKLLGPMVKYAKDTLGYESVSIISNASKITEEWFDEYGAYLDILGVSCDATEEAINIEIGRGRGKHVDHIRRAARLCQQHGIKFKINTVVNRYNHHCDMSSFINELSPMRWKVFQVLPLEGENSGTNATRDVTRFLISTEEFQDFIQLNQDGLQTPSILKVEGNDVMQSSYVLVDEFGAFLDSSGGGKVATKSLLDVGVDVALQQLLSSENGGFNHDAFVARDGDYASTSWSRAPCSNVVDMEDIGR